jgi:hypothetical protein
MKIMTKNGSNTSIRYDQTKRVIDSFLLDLRQQGDLKWNLETCNVCASCCAIEAVGAKFKCTLPKIDNQTFISQADLMFDFIYKSKDTPVRQDKLCENEVPANLEFAINKMSTAKAKLKQFNSVNEFITSLQKDLNSKKAIVLSYLTDYGTGHFICLVGIDSNTIFAYDSWGDNKHCKKGGKLEEYDLLFFKERCKERLRYISVE